MYFFVIPFQYASRNCLIETRTEVFIGWFKKNGSSLEAMNADWIVTWGKGSGCFYIRKWEISHYHSVIYSINKKNVATYIQGVERYIPNLLSVTGELLNVELEILKAQCGCLKTGTVGVHTKMFQHKIMDFGAPILETNLFLEFGDPKDHVRRQTALYDLTCDGAEIGRSSSGWCGEEGCGGYGNLLFWLWWWWWWWWWWKWGWR